ncbi:hypothetical protein DXG01_009413, partial [Tephrocybe rancida]
VLDPRRASTLAEMNSTVDSFPTAAHGAHAWHSEPPADDALAVTFAPSCICTCTRACARDTGPLLTYRASLRQNPVASSRAPSRAESGPSKEDNENQNQNQNQMEVGRAPAPAPSAVRIPPAPTQPSPAPSALKDLASLTPVPLTNTNTPSTPLSEPAPPHSSTRTDPLATSSPVSATPTSIATVSLPRRPGMINPPPPHLPLPASQLSASSLYSLPRTPLFPVAITPRQPREGEEIILPENTRLDKYISGTRSGMQFKIDKRDAENHTEPTALSSLNIAISAYRLSSEDYYFIYDVGAWEHRLLNALLVTSKHVSQMLESRFQVQAIQRSQADKARATEQIQQERRGLGSSVPTEDFPTSYWEFLQLTFDTRWNALATHSDQDPEEAAAHLQNSRSRHSVAAHELLRDDGKEIEIKVWSDIPRSINNITCDPRTSTSFLYPRHPKRRFMDLVLPSGSSSQT